MLVLSFSKLSSNGISDFIELRCQISKKIALVPTMGSIHEGHISLVETAKKHGDTVVATIFVNPIQFNNTEDYISYPKNLDKDVIKSIKKFSKINKRNFTRYIFKKKKIQR